MSNYFYFINLIPVWRFSFQWGFITPDSWYTKYHLSARNTRTSFKKPFSVNSFFFLSFFFYGCLSFKRNKPKTNHPSTLRQPFLDRSVRWSGSDGAGLRGESGKSPRPRRAAAPTLPTDVVISHWNLNQTINIQQLSCAVCTTLPARTRSQGSLCVMVLAFDCLEVYGAFFFLSYTQQKKTTKCGFLVAYKHVKMHFVLRMTVFMLRVCWSLDFPESRTHMRKKKK